MGRKEHRVCAACTHNCLLFHQTKQTSPTSFFKVIAKQEYLTTLYIPPDFSCTVSDLVNKKIILNDSSGQHWKVKVSKVNGSFAFEEGWNVFSLDHGLKVGYLLVFNYIKDLHFDVKIYDISACEKLDFSKKGNQKKRSRGRSGSPVRDDILVRQGPNALVVSQLHVPKVKSQQNEVDLVETQNSKEGAQLMCISEHCEDPCYSTSLEFDQSHGVDGTMKIANRDSKVSDVDYGTHIHQNDAIVCKDTMVEAILDIGATLDISELEMSGRNNSPGEADKSKHDKTSTLELEEKEEKESIMFNKEAQECQFAEGLGLPKETKGELGHCSESSDTFDQDNESLSNNTAILSCVVPNDNIYLKLPKCLALSGRVKVFQQRQMVVYLRDPVRRLWPVFYHEQPQLPILTHGWFDFSRANNIEPEDVCIFEAVVEPESKSKRILAVRIVHK